MVNTQAPNLIGAGRKKNWSKHLVNSDHLKEVVECSGAEVNISFARILLLLCVYESSGVGSQGGLRKGKGSCNGTIGLAPWMVLARSRSTIPYIGIRNLDGHLC